MPPKTELPDHWWDKTYDELAEYFGVSRSTIGRWRRDLDLPKKTQWNRVEHTHGVSMTRVLYHLHHDAEMATPEMADALDISRGTLAEWFLEVDVHKRSRSEAEKLKNEKKSEEERRQQTRAAREELPDGGGTQMLWNEQPDEQMELVQEVAYLGADAREENGMKGVTGQDHPNWNGGKSIYDAVKKQLGDESWNTTRTRIRDRDGECRMCGCESDSLDVHHLIPLMAGGCHADELLIALCSECHRRVEAYISFECVLCDGDS